MSVYLLSLSDFARTKSLLARSGYGTTSATKYPRHLSSRKRSGFNRPYRRSGAGYALNRWRETPIENNRSITYRDLVQHFIRLRTTKGRLPQIPSVRLNNLVGDFLAAKKGNRDQAFAAWEALKTLDVPENYAAGKRYYRRGIDSEMRNEIITCGDGIFIIYGKEPLAG